jgi:alkylation response protein AidB-like acyl-CoA dehydrogenase
MTIHWRKCSQNGLDKAGPFHPLSNSNFGLPAEEVALQEAALSFANAEMKPHASHWDEHQIFPKETFKAAGQLGFGGLFAKSDHGGSELSQLSGSVVLEALATGCVTSSAYIAGHNMVGLVIDRYGDDSQRAQWMPQLNSFEWCGSYCLTEAGSGSDAGAMKTSAKEDGGDFVLNGSKMFIGGGDATDLYLVFCKTGEKEISAIVVEQGTPGLGFGKRDLKLGWNAQPHTLVTFDNVRVPRSNLIGQRGKGFKIALNALNGGRVNSSSCALGGAWDVLNRTRLYMGDRKQFGKQLKEFQYLSFTMADQVTAFHASRFYIRNAAQALDRADPEAAELAAMAKKFTVNTCYQIVDRCLQMHGGYGYLKDFGIERILRDLRAFSIVEGTDEVCLMVVSRKLFS